MQVVCLPSSLLRHKYQGAGSAEAGHTPQKITKKIAALNSFMGEIVIQM